MKDIVKLEKSLFKIVQNQSLTGLSVAQINGSVRNYVNYGSTKNKWQSPITEHTIFEFASLTKPIVSIIAVKIFHSCGIPLQTRISDLLPEYQIYSEVTLLHLLTHSAGFPNWPDEEHKKNICFKPGSRFSYSGFGFNLLERIFYKVSNKNSEELLNEIVCFPLSLKNTSFIFDKLKLTQIAIGTKHGRIKNKWKPNLPNLAGSLHSTVHDYSTIIQDMFSPNSVVFDEYTRTHLFHEYQNVNIDFSNSDNWPNEKYEIFDNIFWGLGWGIEISDHSKYYWHWGDNEVFQSFFWINPKEREAIILATNCENGNKSWGLITQKILDRKLESIKWLENDKRFMKTL